MSNIKVIKLSNGEDIVCSLIKGEKQLPDKSPLLRLDRPLLIKYEYDRPPVKPESKKYIREKFTDEENKKINQIFNFYDDGDDTLH